jgi:hypothetical protein
MMMKKGAIMVSRNKEITSHVPNCQKPPTEPPEIEPGPVK